MLQPPVSTPTARSTAMPTSRMCWYSRSVRVIAGATVIESPVCTPIGSTFSIEQTTTTLSCLSRISSSSNSFQPSTDSSTSTSCTGLAASPRATMTRTWAASSATPEPRPPMVNDGRTTMRLPTVSAKATASSRLWQTEAVRHVGADAAHDVLEPLPVLAALDGVDVGADQLDAVLPQHAAVVQFDGEVQRRLPAEGGQQGVDRVAGLLLGGQHLLDELDGERLDVGGVGELRVGHDRRRVGVDQADAVALGAQHAAGLGAGVVELAGLADDDRPGPDHQDVADVVALQSRHSPPLEQSSTKRSNR